MNVRKIKRKCMMRGCKNTESYSLSLTREMGNSVILCAECAKKAYETINEYEKPKEEVKKLKTEPKNLEENNEDLEENNENLEENTLKYICPNCSREFSSQRGLKVYMPNTLMG